MPSPHCRVRPVEGAALLAIAHGVSLELPSCCLWVMYGDYVCSLTYGRPISRLFLNVVFANMVDNPQTGTSVHADGVTVELAFV